MFFAVYVCCKVTVCPSGATFKTTKRRLSKLAFDFQNGKKSFTHANHAQGPEQGCEAPEDDGYGLQFRLEAIAEAGAGDEVRSIRPDLLTDVGDVDIDRTL